MDNRPITAPAPPDRPPPPLAPPGPGDPDDGPDPRDPGPPIRVRLEGVPLGDLGHPRVDGRLLQAVLLRGSPVAQWLGGEGIDRAQVDRAFGDTGWPLTERPGQLHAPPNAKDPSVEIAIHLDACDLGDLGTAPADGRLLTAIAVRPRGRVAAWLADRGITATDLEEAFPGSGWP